MDQSALYGYWGKTPAREGGPCHLLVYHCLDVAAVVRQWLDADPLLRARLARLAQLPEALVVDLLTLMAAWHDMGKFSLLFQAQAPDLLASLQGRQPRAGSPLRHRQLGLLAWKLGIRSMARREGWWGLNDPHGAAWLKALEPWLLAAFGHHGWPEPLDQLPPGVTDPRLEYARHFPAPEQAAALAWAREAAAVCAPDLRLPAQEDPAPLKPYLAAASWLAAGVLVAADWLASNAAYFDYRQEPRALPAYWDQSQDRARAALAHSGLLPAAAAPWAGPRALFPAYADFTPLQHWAAQVELAPGPKLFILEESTGGGKTEAAVILAQRLLAAGEAESVVVALPTMATANAMYTRLADAYRRLFAPGADPSLTLAHSLRNLHPGFTGSVDPAYAPAAPPDEERDCRAHCAAWLADGNKRSLLGSVGIGTIDQAVAALMPLRHQGLRLVGLARAVLIIDEAHAYDDYLTRLLSQGVLGYVAALGGSVILLSATLPRAQKERLAQGFRELYDPEPVVLDHRDYPLATLITEMGPARATPLATRRERQTSFAVELVSDPEQVLTELGRAAAAGGCAAWVRNTVDDALAARERLAELAGPEVVWLLHARFALCDRLSGEARLAAAFGPPHPTAPPAGRAGRIVVGTQVLEQSLDLDFDLMVSDLAPLDLILQRAGRLHRHQRGSRPTGPARLLVLAPEPLAEPPEDWYAALFPGGAYVYRRHALLWRTARLLAQHPVVRLPDDARRLVEAAYDPDGEVPDGLASWEARAEGDTQAALVAAWHHGLKWRDGYGINPNETWDEDTPTRLGEKRVRLLLGRWDGRRLTPWSGEPGWRGWELSQVGVRAHWATAEAPPDTPALARALEAARGELGRRADDNLMVPLAPEADGWWAGAVLDPGQRIQPLRYRADTGLLFRLT